MGETPNPNPTPVEGQHTIESLATRVRETYPGAYQDLGDQELVQKVIAKHPVYQRQLSTPEMERLAAGGEVPKHPLAREFALGALGTVAAESQHPIIDALKGIASTYTDPRSYIPGKLLWDTLRRAGGNIGTLARVGSKLTPAGVAMGGPSEEEKEQGMHALGSVFGMAAPMLGGEVGPETTARAGRMTIRGVGRGMEAVGRAGNAPVLGDINIRGVRAPGAAAIAGMGVGDWAAYHAGMPWEARIAAATAGGKIGPAVARGLERAGGGLRRLGAEPVTRGRPGWEGEVPPTPVRPEAPPPSPETLRGMLRREPPPPPAPRSPLWQPPPSSPSADLPASPLTSEPAPPPPAPAALQVTRPPTTAPPLTEWREPTQWQEPAPVPRTPMWQRILRKLPPDTGAVSRGGVEPILRGGGLDEPGDYRETLAGQGEEWAYMTPEEKEAALARGSAVAPKGAGEEYLERKGMLRGEAPTTPEPEQDLTGLLKASLRARGETPVTERPAEAKVPAPTPAQSRLQPLTPQIRTEIGKIAAAGTRKGVPTDVILQQVRQSLPQASPLDIESVIPEAKGTERLRAERGSHLRGIGEEQGLGAWGRRPPGKVLPPDEGSVRLPEFVGKVGEKLRG